MWGAQLSDRTGASLRLRFEQKERWSGVGERMPMAEIDCVLIPHSKTRKSSGTARLFAFWFTTIRNYRADHNTVRWHAHTHTRRGKFKRVHNLHRALRAIGWRLSFFCSAFAPVREAKPFSNVLIKLNRKEDLTFELSLSKAFKQLGDSFKRNTFLPEPESDRRSYLLHPKTPDVLAIFQTRNDRSLANTQISL